MITSIRLMVLVSHLTVTWIGTSTCARSIYLKSDQIFPMFWQQRYPYHFRFMNPFKTRQSEIDESMLSIKLATIATSSTVGGLWLGYRCFIYFEELASIIPKSVKKSSFRMYSGLFSVPPNLWFFMPHISRLSFRSREPTTMHISTSSSD